MSNHFKEMLLKVTAGSSLQGMRFWFTAEKPLPLSLLQGSGNSANYRLAYEDIDDLMICVQVIPFNIDVYRLFHLAAFLPVWLIRETMPELSMNACTLAALNKLYYRFDGKNDNGKLESAWLPMGGGGYGSIANATVASRINAAWLLNYKSPIPEGDINAMNYCEGWHFQDSALGELANSAIGKITDLNLPNAVISNAVILANKRNYMEHIATTYDLAWWEMMLQTKYSRVKDPALRQKVLDNLLISCNVSSQNSYNSAYRQYNLSPQAYCISPLNTVVLQAAWLQRVGNDTDSGNFFGFYGKLPAYAHFKFSTSNFWISTVNKITKIFADFEDGTQYEWDADVNNRDETLLYKYMCNKNTGWTSANDNVNPTMNAEYMLRAAYSNNKQQIAGDIDFKSAITCPDNHAASAMVNLETAQKEIHNVPILNFDYPGVKQ